MQDGDVKTQFAKFFAAAGAAALLATMPFPGAVSTAIAQVALPPLTDPLDPLLDPTLERTQDGLDSRIRRRAKDSQNKSEELPAKADELLEAGGNVASEGLEAADGIANSAQASVAGLVRTFVGDSDPDGWTIEKDVIVMLLDAEQLALLEYGNFDIIARRELRSLGLTVVSLRDAKRANAAQAVSDLRAALPDAAIDFNHIYFFADESQAPGTTTASDTIVPAESARPLRVGMIDSAVETQHFSLADSQVSDADFVTLEGDRPLGHGTAVASLIAGSANNKAQIFAASVFFQAPDQVPGASTDSLVAALDWLTLQQVDVVNMSLAGPPNALLERALAGLAENGPLVVAAVGNDGPSAKPLYPAAYDGVVGVTAIDRDKRVFRYANRGPQVDFAALGVDVKVADAGGSWRVESGTSMAAPHVAVIIAYARHASDLPANALLELLSSNAEDLGRKGFDTVFGHGLIVQPASLISGN